ncbi:hypothetical protein [Leeuwenhoekiella marinoflava]|uniref:Uncharacterized protein n=2 Tax=Leeuwenhoekiella marinoflava TaxID=988 RepID=A0A4Q0PLL4_9FLAO|nr:hypothetical protein [Leeuwenhoekiella marinoflava]RXG29922.1 hypothetical protein DSL99_1977 [Leeuwenhoekiella marinoflava]SHF26204.1 hypothetical protein SAMN02745246_02060 [Leeuwenhoekiella marinoflava DSM 3653]
MKSQNEEFNRRSFTKMVTLTSIGVLLMPKTTLGNSSELISIHSPEILAVDPMTAMAIAQTGMSLINSFSSGPGDPMIAMMKYQNGMLKVINEQLNSIQFSLVEIQNAINSLPHQIRKELEIQYKTELLGEISAAARRYNDNMIAASIENPRIFDNEEVKNEVVDIITTADQCLSILRDSKEGKGPDACLILPLALSLEIAGRTNLNYPIAVIKAAIVKYDSWFNDMLSDQPGSIYDVQNKAIAKHDALISSFDNDQLAVRLGLKNYKVNASQESKVIDNPTVMFAGFGPENITGVDFDSKGGTWDSSNIIRITSRIYSRLTKLKSTLNTDLNANFVDIEVVQTRYAKGKQQVELLEPKTGDYVYVYEHFNIPAGYNRDQVEDHVMNKNIPWKSDRDSESKINLALKEINLLRAEISLCSMAITIAYNSKNRIKEYLELL